MHDLAVLWQEQAGGPEAFQPGQLYNFPLPRRVRKRGASTPGLPQQSCFISNLRLYCRYCHDSVLWRMLAELPSWRAFHAYLKQLQVGEARACRGWRWRGVAAAEGGATGEAMLGWAGRHS